jgi:type IX secretion system PorP/SprF family membrane protein
MVRIKNLVFLILCLSPTSIWGQDPHFSNFNYNKMYYNPAYAGIDYGIKLNMAYRRQWPKIPSKFQTFYTGFDQGMRVARGVGGFGLIVVSNTEGEGVLQNYTIGIPISARVPIAEKSLIQVGVMPSIGFNSINWDRFIFSGQLNPYYGNINPSGFVSPDDGISHRSYVDLFNIGGVYRYENNSSQANSYRFYRKFEIGLSAFHLSEPNQSFTHSEAPLPARYVLFTNYTVSVPLKSAGLLFIEPSFLGESQSQMFSYMLGVTTSFVDSNIDFGVWFRNRNTNLQNTDAIVFLFAYRFLVDKANNTVLTTSLSYDITTSKLVDASRGSPEVTISLALKNKTFFNDKPDRCDEGSNWSRKNATSKHKK